MAKQKIDLNAPAFGKGAQVIEETAEETVVEPVVEEQKPKEQEPVASEEETKVPYSRFKKYHDAAKEAEKEAAYWREQAEQRREYNRPSEPQVDLQDEAYKLWIENYGDNEASHKAWKNQLKITQTLEERAIARAEERAKETYRNERYEEAARTEENVDVLDDRLEDLSAVVGRDLSEKEQLALLEIVDDYTPKDREGNYLGEIMPFEKAWRIYELEQQASKAPKVQARNQVASLSGSQSQGDPSNVAEANKNFNPLDWNAWRKRIGD